MAITGGAIGYLVGEKNRGLEYMFTMMNLARHAVGVEGLAVAERAYQACDRICQAACAGYGNRYSGAGCDCRASRCQTNANDDEVAD